MTDDFELARLVARRRAQIADRLVLSSCRRHSRDDEDLTILDALAAADARAAEKDAVIARLTAERDEARENNAEYRKLALARDDVRAFFNTEVAEVEARATAAEAKNAELRATVGRLCEILGRLIGEASGEIDGLMKVCGESIVLAAAERSRAIAEAGEAQADG